MAEGRDAVRLAFEGPIAIISYDRPEKHNAFSDAMDARLFEILQELHGREGLRAVVWRGEGASFSSGRDTGELGQRKEGLSDLDFIERGHRGSQRFLDLPAPILVALTGWVIGGSLERALLCDIRVAGAGAKLRLPELQHGVVPDSGGTARLFQMAGHGVAADLALSGRVMGAEEALRHGIVSRVVPFAVRMFLRSLRRMANPPVQQALAEEALAQSLVFGSGDYAEQRAARAEGRDPVYRNR